MKKSFHVFFLFVLFAFFAVNAAWARQVTLSIDPYTGDRFINISKDSNDPDTLAIPSNVTTFKVYDDGGKDGNYSYGYSRLTLTTSESNKLYVNGFAWLEKSNSYIYIYDGGTSDDTKFSYVWDNVENARAFDRLSSGNSIMIYLEKRSSGLAEMAGFDFSVTVIPPRSVSVKSVSGGSAVSNKSSAYYRDTITLSATPNTGYFLKEVTLKDDAGYKMNVDVNVDWLSGTAKFVMPDMNTNVYPVFSNNVTAENGFYLNMPSYTYSQTVQQTIDIPEGTVSFKVYDDGGKDGDYSHPGESYLQLTAPAKGERFRITGFVQTNESHARLTIYNGKKGTTALLNQKYSPTSAAEMTDIGTIVSSKNIVTLYFVAYNFESAAGLDLKVEILQGISISKAENGSVTTDKNVAEAGEKVTLTPNPEDGYALSSLVVTDAGGNVVPTTELANGTFTFNMPRSGGVTVTPTFVRIPKINIVSVPGGKILTGYANASEGQNVILLISPDPDYVFAGLEVKEDATGNDVAVVIISDGEANYTMPASDVTVTPSWAHSVETPNYTGGTVAADKAIASKDETVTLTVSSDKGYVLQKLDLFNRATDETVELVVSDGKAMFTMPEANVVVTPYWEKINYSVSVIGGGVKTDKKKATYGETVTLTIEPDDNYLFSSLDVKDVDENPVTVTLSDDKTSATFTMPASNVSVTSLWNQIYDVEIISVAGGTVTTDKERAAVGQTVSLTITPADRHGLTKLRVAKKNNNSYSSKVELTDGKATFTMPNYDVVVTPFWDVNVLTEDGEGGLYVNMPEIGTKTVDIPENVKSFKVYDDGGKDENYNVQAEGYLVLNAPEGYLLQVTGTACYTYAYFYIYDGDSEAEKLFDEEHARNGIEVGTIRSSGNKLTIRFQSRNRTQGTSLSGLDLTVSLVKVDFGAVSIAKADDGKLHATIEGAYSGDEALKITEAITVDNVELNREFSTNGQGFSTIVLPFDFNAAALTGVKSVIEFTGMTKNGDVGMSYIWCDEKVQENIRKEAEAAGKGDNYDHCNTDKANFPGDMIAYTPYMVQMENSQIGFDYVGGVTLEVTPDKAQARVGDWVFRGTTEKKVFDAEETKDGNVWGFAAKVQDAAEYVGQFVRLGAGASAQPLRAYMVFDPVSSDPPAQFVKSSKNAFSAAKPAKANSVAGSEIASLPDNIDVVIVSRGGNNEEHRTVIGTLTRSTGEFKMRRDYDLKGRKVNAKIKARGAYYGKKVLKK